MSNKAAFLLLLVALGGLFAGIVAKFDRNVNNIRLSNGLEGSYDSYTETFTLYNEDARRWQGSSNLVIRQDEVIEKAAEARRERAVRGFGTAAVCGTISIGSMVRNSLIKKKKDRPK